MTDEPNIVRTIRGCVRDDLAPTPSLVGWRKILAHIDTIAAARDALAREHAALTAELDADLGYGNCPVQIEGTAMDRQYYFRARGTHFSLCVSAPGDTSEYAAVNGTPILEGVIHDPFSAGWMPHTLAKALTVWALGVWQREANGTNKRSASEILEMFATEPDAARADAGGLP